MRDEFIRAWVAVRMMDHLERMEMIRRGMLPPPQAASLDACMFASRGIMLGMMVAVLVAGLSFIVLADDMWWPGPHWYAGMSGLPILLGLAFLALVVRNVRGRRLRHKTIRDAGASLRLP